MPPKVSPADMVRDVPEMAVRLYLGAKTEPAGSEIAVELDGRTDRVSADVYSKAEGVAKALSIRPRTVEGAPDVLELRHAAEDIYLEQLLGEEDLPKILFVP